MKLSLYLARRFLRSIGLVAGSFFAILFSIEVIEQLRRFATSGASIADGAIMSALVVPGRLYQILPILMMLAGVVLFLGLARSSELVVIRAAGRSALRMLVAPVVTAFLVGALAVAVLNPIIAGSGARYDEYSARFKGGLTEGASVSIGSEGLWLRQGVTPPQSPSPSDKTLSPETSQIVIHATRANLTATTLYEATFLMFSADEGPIRRLEAQEAVLSDGGWTLTGVKDWPLTGSTNPERDATLRETMTLASDLTPERIREGFAEPQAISIWKLPSFIRELNKAGFSAVRHELWFQMELAMPFVLVAMVLIAAGFTMRHVRFGGTGRMVMSSLFAGLGVFFLRSVAQVLGENGQIPVALAAWAPPAIAGMLAITLLLHLEDG
jgi:lipopolysaccharide export system permease protein